MVLDFVCSAADWERFSVELEKLEISVGNFTSALSSK